MCIRDRYHRKRYPVEKSRYYQCVGRLLPHRIGQIIEELLKEMGYRKGQDFAVWINPKQGNDVDLKVWFHGQLIIVAEILNWSIKSKLSEKRKENIVNNLLSYNCEGLLICTVLENLNFEEFEKREISVLRIGYQLLPKDFYMFFSKKSQTELRKIDSKETRNDIKLKIKEILKEIGIKFVNLQRIAFDGGQNSNSEKKFKTLNEEVKEKKIVKKKEKGEERLIWSEVDRVCRQYGFRICNYCLHNLRDECSKLKEFNKLRMERYRREFTDEELYNYRMKKTEIVNCIRKRIISQIKGYRTFSRKIDIRDLDTLRRIKKEKEQYKITDFLNGRVPKIL